MTTTVVRTLVANARAGDDAAWRALLDAALPRLLLFIRARLGAALRADVDGEDVLQETLLLAHEGLLRFEPQDDQALGRWLCSIAEHRIRGLADRQGAAKRPPPGRRLPDSALAAIRDARTGPATAAARSEARERLARALATLPEADRVALLLRHFQGCTIDEIAQLQRESGTSVRRRLGRAQVALGAALEGGS